MFASPRREPNDEHLNLIERKTLQALLATSGADRRLRSTLRSMTGDAFTQKELRVLEERMLRRISRGDVGVLSGIREGAPAVVSPNQKAAIDRLMDEVGFDDLGRRARGAYERALARGQVVVH